MSNEPLFDSIREFGVIHPGDTLLLSTEQDLTHYQAYQIKTMVRERMPDVNVVVVSGLKVTVLRDVG